MRKPMRPVHLRRSKAVTTTDTSDTPAIAKRILAAMMASAPRIRLLPSYCFPSGSMTTESFPVPKDRPFAIRVQNSIPAYTNGTQPRTKMTESSAVMPRGSNVVNALATSASVATAAMASTARAADGGNRAARPEAAAATCAGRRPSSRILLERSPFSSE